MTRRQRRSLRDYAADPGHWAGYTSDVAETSQPVAWLRVWRLELYLSWRP